jgi:gamma-F420-2:alpha-L-glutamate ligase
MVGWLIYHKEAAIYNDRYIQFYMEEGRKLDVEVRLILVEELEFGVKNHTWFLRYKNEEIPLPDFAICRAIYPLLSRQLEMIGIPVFNNSFVSEICNDKARTYQYLAKTGIRMVDTSFYKNEQLLKLLEEEKKVFVIKAVDGHGGSQVFLTGDEKNGIPATDLKREILSGIGSSDFVKQPLVGSRHQDLRVYVIGTEIIAAVLRTAREGFKSNFSLGGEVRLYELSREEENIVRKIIREFDFGLVGIDFILGEQGELIFNEIEDVVGSRMLYQCSNINIVGRYLSYILDRLRKNTD